MKLTEYGRTEIIKVLVLSILIDFIAFLISIFEFKIILLLVSLILFSFTLFFFRDPERKIDKTLDQNFVLSPADGKIVLLGKVTNQFKKLDFFNQYNELLQISIFMSPLNVHINRIPFSGQVKYIEHKKGKFFAAFKKNAGELNEQTLIGIENDSGKQIIFRQVAGFLARRIVYNIKTGDFVERGSRFGMIKFGSRVDIFLSPDAKLLIKLNNSVLSGLTPIAII
ncbi:MAG: phosphatidylserine decarboxylase family protein [Ignavibacteria bacterium]